MISRAKGKELETLGEPHTRSPETGRTDASGEPVMKLQTQSDDDFHEVQNLIKFLIISQAAPTVKLTENSCNSRQRVWVTEKYPSAHISSDGGLVAGVTKKNPPGHVSSANRGGWRQAGSVGDKKTPPRAMLEVGGRQSVGDEQRPLRLHFERQRDQPLRLAFEVREGG